MKEFADLWFTTLHTWPDDSYQRRVGNQTLHILYAFDQPLDHFKENWERGSYRNDDRWPFEIKMRRLLESEPALAPQIIRWICEKKVQPPNGADQPQFEQPSAAIYVIWAKADLPGLIRWAESQDMRVSPAALEARSFLMSRVDENKRERWLAEAKAGEKEVEFTSKLMTGWAAWEPASGIAAAARIGQPQVVWRSVEAAASGPFPRYLLGYGFPAVKEFDIMKLPPDVVREASQEWDTIMLPWGDFDIGETARYGVDFLTRTGFAPRDRLLRFFSGVNEYPDTGDMIDRTICALRVWAAVRPKEMKTWIGTLQDTELKKALTWLLNHPEGT